MSGVLACRPAVVRLCRDFDSLGLQPAQWAAVAASGDTCQVFQQWHWQRLWWAAFGRGELAILAAQDGERTTAIAPFFVDGRMAYLVGSGGSDYLDFIGEVAAPGVLECILGSLLRAHPDLLGIVLYLVPDASRTGALLQQACARLGLRCIDEGGMRAPAMAIPQLPAAPVAADKRSLVRHERQLRRAGAFSVLHLRQAAEIRPWLDRFFEQHVHRWRDTGSPSLFNDPAQRRFYRLLADHADVSGWLRFTVVLAEGEAVAFHFGMAWRGRFLWYKPSFDPGRARQSPGEVLLRQLILQAQAEACTCFDFGLGDEAFKHRFADHFLVVRTWGLYTAAAGAR